MHDPEAAADALPSRFDPSAIEDALYAMWERGGFFHADPGAGGEPFVIVIPPPNVTGYLHIGHTLNNTLQDILVRWRRMQGRNTLWVPGTDHAGIATQHVVARALWNEEHTDWRALGRERFLERVWQWKEQYGSRIIRQLKRLGCSCDWSRERFTMDPGLSRAVLTVFKRLYDEGLIYRGDYLVNWSPKLQTALSDDEVVHKEVQGHLWHIRYPLDDGSGSLVVATTRPETMLGDTAVAVHPEDPRYASMVGKAVRLPLTGRVIPVVADPMVDRAFGTGAVKVTPAHDPNDYELARRHGLPMINILHPDGTLNDAVPPPYRGLPAAEARRRVVEDLQAQGLLVKTEPHTHNVGHCYRSGCVIEPMLSKQWFVRMRPLVGPAIEAVRSGRVRFVPDHYENVYFHWMEHVRDWCISRQLWWGHRIPIYTCRACGAERCAIDLAPTQCLRCGAKAMEQDPDVLDTWFSSALWPFSTLGWPDSTPELARYYPTTVLVTAHDIIFFWVARMIIMGLKFMGREPFGTVVINPLVMDEHGRKMSKSSGTAIDPIEVIERYGTDAVRLALASYPTQARHISLSEKRFETWRNFANKLWNAARFVLLNTRDLPAAALRDGLPTDALELEDRWILGALGEAAERATAALEAFRFDEYLDAIYRFVWNQYCDWYVELVKDRLRGGAPEATGRGAAPSRRAAQIVLVAVLEHTLRLLHPAAPFVSEAIWQRLRARWAGALAADRSDPAAATMGALLKPSVMIAPWPKVAAAVDPGAAEAMALIQEAIGRIRTIRGEMNIPPAMPTDVALRGASPERLDVLRRGEHYFRSLIALGDLRIGPDAGGEGFAATGVVQDVTIHVYLPRELADAERSRLDKEIARLEKGVAGAQAKLANPRFAEHAPPDVVAAERDRLTKLQTELDSLRRRREALR